MSGSEFTNCTMRLGEVEFHCNHHLRYCETRFADGTTVPATPQDNEGYYETAAELGYEADIWAMCREHEALHSWLAHQLGMPVSPTLWAVAHGGANASLSGLARVEEQHVEESLVLSLQKFCNGVCAQEELDLAIRHLSEEAKIFMQSLRTKI